jgi:DNA-directed RNA polymerase subunit RPC12/RpoP
VTPQPQYSKTTPVDPAPAAPAPDGHPPDNADDGGGDADSERIRPAALYRCPQCNRVSQWTDGKSADTDHEVDEMWCQTCGHEFDPHPHQLAQELVEEVLAALAHPAPTRWSHPITHDRPAATREPVYSLAQPTVHSRSVTYPTRTLCGHRIGPHWLNGGEDLSLCGRCRDQLERTRP